MTSPLKLSTKPRHKMQKNSDKSISKLMQPALLLSMSSFLVFSFVVSSEAAFTSKSTAVITTQSDTLQPPDSLQLESLVGGQTKLTWAPSPSSFTTGYKVLRSKSMYGPWEELETVQGRSVTSYIDTTSGNTQWTYRVEAVWDKWVSVSPGFEAPPAVGRSFFDDFSSDGNLNGKLTEDGKSTWQVWSGDMSASGGGASGTPGTGPSPGNGDVAVVRTPVNDGWVYATDFDGYERVILRGKDPNNYIYAGGAEVWNTAKSRLDPGYFEIVEVRNGVKYVLASTYPGTNKDFRVEVKGDTIRAYIDADKGDSTSGTLHLTAISTFQQTDSLATYFGIGFNRGGYAINDFTFQAFD